MADESSSQEKTEEATPKRLREAHKKGQVPRSKDLNTVVILIVAFALLAFMVSFFYDEFRQILLAAIDLVSQKKIDEPHVLQFIHAAFFTFIKVLLPFVLILAAIATAASFFQTGPVFSTEPLKPQAKRLNMVENAKNLFKITTFIELLKNIARIFLVFYMAYIAIKLNLDQILMTTTTDLPTSAHIAEEVLKSFLMRVFAIFIIIAIIDVMVQRWQFKKQLRMTKEEVKREYKQDEGDPLIKSIRKQLHQELAMGDVKRQVASSDVVVTNPTHLAIAVKYDDKEMMAPQIMAKGQRLFAEKIREIAEEEGIPIVQNIPLAWSLIELEIGAEIPEELYQAMAEVLVVLYRMRDKSQSMGK